VTHYKTNTRTDTEYWRANAANMDLSDSLKQLFSMWVNGESIAGEVGKQAIGRGYPIFSWYCILAGMGVFPSREKLRPARSEEHYPMSEIDDLIGRSALNFNDQRQVLENIPARRRGESVQIYYW
jgi:hypothetical protein